MNVISTKYYSKNDCESRKMHKKKGILAKVGINIQFFDTFDTE